MKLLRVLFGFAILGIGASLPWIVQDHLHEKKRTSTSVTKTAQVREAKPLGAKTLASMRNWFSGFGSAPEIDRFPGTSRVVQTVSSSKLKTSERSEAVAGKVSPLLKPELAKLGLKMGDPVFIRIFKEESQLELWMLGDGKTEFQLFKTYGICNYSGTLGPKLKEGDGQSPEGFYFVSPGRMNPNSQFHLSFDLGFPNDYDSYHGRTGSYLMVHGACVSIGCYAMTDERIEEIYTLAAAALSGGQKYFRVHAFPFRMSDDRMNKEAKDKAKWIDFWGNLKEGYDYFEMMKMPPDTNVSAGKYVFSAG